MKKLLIPFLILMTTFFSEADAQVLPSPSSIFKPTIIFGSGGGVVGKVKQYTLQSDGKILLKDGILAEEKDFKTISQDSTDAIFKEVKTFFSKNKNYKKPSNIYLFMKLKERAKTSEMTWGGTKSKPPLGCKSLFLKLIKLVE